MKKVFVLGAGTVAGPCIDYLFEQPGLKLTVADKDLKAARAAVCSHPRGQPVEIDVDHETPRDLIRDSDIVLNLLPKEYLSEIAKVCVQEKTSMIGATYLTEEMLRMDTLAGESGVLILGEVGLDPGIDHMMAVHSIKNLQGDGAEIKSYRSMCGAIPSHSSNNNPVGYKFSWSPSGAISAAKRPARYLDNGDVVEVAGESVMRNYFFEHVPEVGWFECYPNGDALPYRDIYGIPEVSTIFRGTYRFAGWCDTMAALTSIGALDDNQKYDLSNMTYQQFTSDMLGDEGEASLQTRLERKLNIPKHSSILKKIRWLGLLKDEVISLERGSPADVTSQLMLEKLQYSEDEQDMVVMTHEYLARFPDGKLRRLLSTLVDYGQSSGHSSVARTTGLPIAITCRLMLQGRINLKGVKIPVHQQLYEPVLEELDEMGIHSREIIDLP